LVQRENRAVSLLRLTVLLVLLAAAFVTVWLVYHSFRNKEYVSFEEEYRAITTRLIDLYRNDILQKLWVARNLASSLTAMIVAQQLQAPNITIPSFDALSEAAVRLAPVGTVKWAPLLFTPVDQRAFAAYAALQPNVSHPVDDEEEDLGEDDNDSTRRKMLGENQSLSSPVVFNISSPVWQASPSFGANHNARNYDLMTHPIFRDALLAMMEVKGPVMTRTYVLGPSAEDESEDESEESEDEDSEAESEDEGTAASENEDEEENEQEDENMLEEEQGVKGEAEAGDGEANEEEQSTELVEATEHSEEKEEATLQATLPQPVTDNGGSRRRRRRRLGSSDSASGDEGSAGGDGMERAMTLFFPVFDDDEKTSIVGSVSLELVFGSFLSGYLSHEGHLQLNYVENVFDTDEVDAILENTCGQVFTTNIDDSKFSSKCIAYTMPPSVLGQSNKRLLCLAMHTSFSMQAPSSSAQKEIFTNARLPT
jgi:hypothetical protein